MKEKLPDGFKLHPDGTLTFDMGKDRVACTAELPQPDIGVKFWLSDGDGDPLRKELRISVVAGGLPGTVTERRQFHSDEQAHDWLQFILLDLAYQLPFALRSTILLSIEESLYKACERFNVHNFDETKREVSERHLKILRQRKSKVLQTRRGPQKGRKWSRITRQRIEKVPEVIRQLDDEGERVSLANVAQRLGIRGNGIARAKSLSRVLKRYRPNESWTQILKEARKKGR